MPPVSITSLPREPKERQVFPRLTLLALALMAGVQAWLTFCDEAPAWPGLVLLAALPAACSMKDRGAPEMAGRQHLWPAENALIPIGPEAAPIAEEQATRWDFFGCAAVLEIWQFLMA